MAQFPLIPSLPIAPSRLDEPAVFVPRADAFLGALGPWGLLLNDWAAALPSQITGTDYTGSSTTSLTIGTGAKTFVSSTGRNWQIGQPIRIAYTTTPSNYMDGQVTAYNSVTGSMTVTVTAVGGSGTQANWTLSLIPGSGAFVTFSGVETLTGKTLISPTIATIINGAATLTLPGTTDTLVGKATTDIFTNKTFDAFASGNVFKFNGNTFACAAGTHTITMFSSTDTIVGRNTTDTLTNKTLLAPTINGGTLRGDVAVSDGGTIGATSAGFRGVPPSANASGTIALSDNGKYIIMSGNWVIPSDAALHFPEGAVIEFINDSGTPRTISITSDTLRWSGTTNTGTRTVAPYGRCWIQKVGATTVWYIGGDLT